MSPAGIGPFVGGGAAVAWVDGDRLRGGVFDIAFLARLFVQDSTFGGVSGSYWIQYVDDPLGAGFVGFAADGSPRYAQVQANQIVQLTGGAAVEDADALPGWRVSAVRDGASVWMVWATVEGALRWVRITDGVEYVRARIFGPIQTRAGTYDQPYVTLSERGPLIHFSGGVGADVRVAFIRREDGAYLGDTLVQENAWNVVALGGYAAWLAPNLTEHVETGCR